jgi:hypothetical protein
MTPPARFERVHNGLGDFEAWHCSGCDETLAIRMPGYGKPKLVEKLALVPARTRHSSGLPWYQPVRGGRRRPHPDEIDQRREFGFEKGYTGSGRAPHGGSIFRPPSVVTCWCGTESLLTRAADAP